MKSKIFLCSKLDRLVLSTGFSELLSWLSPAVSLDPLPLGPWGYAAPGPSLDSLLFLCNRQYSQLSFFPADKSQTDNFFKLQSPHEICVSPTLNVNSKNSYDSESPNHKTNLFHSVFLFSVNHQSWRRSEHRNISGSSCCFHLLHLSLISCFFYLERDLWFNSPFLYNLWHSGCKHASFSYFSDIHLQYLFPSINFLQCNQNNLWKQIQACQFF